MLKMNTYEKSLPKVPVPPILLRIGTNSSLSEPESFSLASSRSICRSRRLFGDCFSDASESVESKVLEVLRGRTRCSSSSSLELPKDFCFRMAAIQIWNWILDVIERIDMATAESK